MRSEVWWSFMYVEWDVLDEVWWSFMYVEWDVE